MRVMFWDGCPARILYLQMLFVVVLLASTGLLYADSEFPSLPPITPIATETNSAKLLTNIAFTSPGVTNVVDTNAVADMSTNPMDMLDDGYRLAIGDSVNFQVLEDKEDPDNSGDAQAIVVTDSGDVEIPYIGRFPAVGKTCKDLAQQLKVELEKKYYYHATVIISVKSMTSKGVIYVMGGVKMPGPLELPRDDVLTVSKAILRAGGFDDFADEKHVQVTRRGENGTNDVFTVNVSAVLDRSKLNEDRRAEPGDLIYVPEKTFRY